MDKVDDYYGLIDRVAKIDIQAAMYLRYDAQNLELFGHDGDISHVMYWADTPQGFDYWADIADKLSGDEYWVIS